MNSTLKLPSPTLRVKRVPETKKIILLVDDDPAIRQILLRLLAEEDYTVLTASNGFEAVELVKNMEVDLVLLDLNMPIKDGWDTFKQLKSENPLLPVVIITARSNQIFPALASGIGTLMEKPLDFAKLFREIHDLLEESIESRLARVEGCPSEFHYVPRKGDKSKENQS